MGKDNRDIERAKNKLAQSIKNDIDDIAQIKKGTLKEEKKLQCKCSHCDTNGNPAVFKHPNATSPVTNNPLFVCRICKKYLDIYEVSQEEFDRAVDIIDRSADVVKIRLNPSTRSTEEDQKLYRSVYKMQYFVTGKFVDLVKAARTRNTKKKGTQKGNFTVMSPSR